MYERIDRLREDLERARKRRAEAEARVRLCESKLKEAENNQIIAEVAKRKLRPEQVAQLLALATDGQLEALLSGKPTEVSAKDSSEDLLAKESMEVDFDYDESEENEDEENE